MSYISTFYEKMCNGEGCFICRCSSLRKKRHKYCDLCVIEIKCLVPFWIFSKLVSILQVWVLTTQTNFDTFDFSLLRRPLLYDPSSYMNMGFIKRCILYAVHYMYINTDRSAPICSSHFNLFLLLSSCLVASFDLMSLVLIRWWRIMMQLEFHEYISIFISW